MNNCEATRLPVEEYWYKRPPPPSWRGRRPCVTSPTELVASCNVRLRPQVPAPPTVTSHNNRRQRNGRVLEISSGGRWWHVKESSVQGMQVPPILGPEEWENRGLPSKSRDHVHLVCRLKCSARVCQLRGRSERLTTGARRPKVQYYDVRNWTDIHIIRTVICEATVVNLGNNRLQRREITLCSI
jgi:hypothetical protein